MAFLNWIKTMITGQISDEEVAATEWVTCPYCNLNIEKDAVTGSEGEVFICPQCKNKIVKQ